MNNEQLCHLWANQSKEHSKGNNMSFVKESIFSYNAKIAKIINENLIFVNQRSYSVTTAKHKTFMYRAIDKTKFKTIELIHIDLNLKEKTEYQKNLHKENLEYFENCITDLNKQFLTSRTRKEMLKAEIESKQSDYIFYAKMFKLKTKKSITNFNLENFKIEIELQLKKNKKIEEKRQKLILKDNQERLNKFLNDNEEIKTIEYRKGTNFLKIQGEKCITNSGAEVETKEVKILVEIIHNAENYCGQSLNGRKLSNFTIDNFTEKGIKIGCHFFDNEEINRIIQLFN